ncbi:MAG: antibiotic biosynthesis monooxygenase [Caulobacter sp.]|nr:antibiotic biosynthesis monooxygenase [Caulobacter sp.]
MSGRANRVHFALTCSRQARAAEGCLDFAVSEDPVEPDRVNVFERWESAEALEGNRGSGMDQAQIAMIAGASVRRYSAEDIGSA